MSPLATASTGLPSGIRPLVTAAAGAAVWLVAALVMVVGLIGTRQPAGPGRLSDAVGRARQAAGRAAAYRVAILAGVICGALAWLFSGMPVAGVTVACAVPGVPWLFRVGWADRTAIARVQAVGEWARRLQMAATAGFGLQQAIVAGAPTAPAAIAADVGDLAARLQAGVEPRGALLRFADAIDDPGADQVIAVLVMHLTDSGDRLGEVLASVAAATTAEVAARREVDARRTQSRFRVRFLTIVTLGALAYGAIRPGFLSPYATLGGQLVLGFIAAHLVGILIRSRLTSQAERAPRLLGAGPDRPWRAGPP